MVNGWFEEVLVFLVIFFLLIGFYFYLAFLPLLPHHFHHHLLTYRHNANKYVFQMPMMAANRTRITVLV
ncbi:hypothetical protein CUU64_20700 [Bacillus sp. V5-8f]|nr:hypothetical protein CUU64_20700 [Bacillus sp. V5-8f]